MTSLKNKSKNPFKGKSTIPYMSINRKLGSFLFNKKAIDTLDLQKGDVIDLDYDEEDNELYLLKISEDELTPEKGFRLYSWGNKGKTLGFSSKYAVKYLVSKKFPRYENKKSPNTLRMSIEMTIEQDIYALETM